MPVNMKTTGVHHLSLRSADLSRSRRFYVETLGFASTLEAPNLFIVAAGGTAIAVDGPEPGRQGGPERRVGSQLVAEPSVRVQEYERARALPAGLLEVPERAIGLAEPP
jgi:catechol 2,3-dioxygenase-like lactoylglutathione lyase family enzyme